MGCGKYPTGLVVATHRFGGWLEHSRSSQDRAWRKGCGDTRARPRRYTGLVAGWSTAGASQDRTWRKGCGDTRARPRRYTGLVCGRISHRFDCQDQVFTSLRTWREEGSWVFVSFFSWIFRDLLLRSELFKNVTRTLGLGQMLRQALRKFSYKGKTRTTQGSEGDKG